MKLFFAAVFVAGLKFSLCENVTLDYNSDNVPVPQFLPASDDEYVLTPQREDDFVFIIVPNDTVAMINTKALTLEVYLDNNNISLWNANLNEQKTIQIDSPDSGASVIVKLKKFKTPTSASDAKDTEDTTTTTTTTPIPPVIYGVYASVYPSPPKNETVLETITAHTVVQHQSAGYPSFSYGRVAQTWQFVPENSDVTLVFVAEKINQDQADKKYATLTVFSGDESSNHVFSYNCNDEQNKTQCPETYTARTGENLTVRFTTTEAIISPNVTTNPAGIAFAVIGSSPNQNVIPTVTVTTTEPEEFNSTTTLPPSTTKGTGTNLSPILSISVVICLLPLLRN